MYFLVYKTTNKTNGKCYVGSHQTKKLDDGYLGSGKYLKRAIAKDGTENFVREILFQFDNPKDMYAKEAEIVNEDFLMNENTYNLKVGGEGGFDHINKSKLNNSGHTKESYRKTAIANSKRMKEECSTDSGKEAMRKMSKLAQTAREKKFPNGTFFGRVHSEETKRKITEARRRRIVST